MQPALAPPPPQIFFGRDAELAHIIQIIFTNITSRPAKIAILGPGGYGKTTLANAVLSDDRVQKHFQDARYFISCESATSSDALLIQIAKTLGLVMGPPDTLWSQIHATLNSKEIVLCLDNFESPWDQSDETKHAVEVLLSQITSLRRVTVLVTMRGAERPGRTEWTQPFLGPLGTISLDAAKEIWKRITGNYDDFSEKLTLAVDCVPLAVDLLAHLSQVTPPMLLWKEWNSRKTTLIKRGELHKLSNMEYSIQLSLDSHRMTSNPLAKDLLGILSMLPDGLHIKQLTRFQEILIDIDMMSCLQVLQQCSLINLTGDRYQPHPIIRQFCNNQGFTLSNHRTSLEEFYISLASIDEQSADPETYAEMILEVNNTKAILSELLKSNSDNQSRLIDAIIDAVIMFTGLCRNIGDFSSTLLNQSVQLLLVNNAAPVHLIQCLKAWGGLCYHADDMETAKQKYLEAERHCLSCPINVDDIHGLILTDLGLVYLNQFALNEAEATYQKALKLNEASQNTLGQGEVYYGLGRTCFELHKFTEAEALYQKALEFHKAADNNIVGQGNDYHGLGETYLRLDRPAEAEAPFQKALEFQKMANHTLNQGNARRGLGDTYRSLKRLDEAEASYHKALEFDMAANNLFNQGIDHQALGEVYLLLNKVNGAEVSFHKALELKKAANDVLGQGIALGGLGRVYMRRSQLKEAKNMLEEALKLYREVQATFWEEQDQRILNDIQAQMQGTALG
ncbi:P-loop containing nucleoside triphosphate hydrolase protein [Multifurca ochricompacta]|uniref:P-loop containing nucleoside triphosphate hydrolase protein n=1 Tax=Multifurca ochricompacta TaxID=376703 RepID=A0AAD4LXX3_9AGAM|nr:P-loop containing nucleoside triphosphate hydrolase protein [Multifurca ochricompacta]